VQVAARHYSAHSGPNKNLHDPRRCSLLSVIAFKMAAMRSLLLALSLSAAVSAQFVSAPKDLTLTKGYLDIPVRYKEVPTGICETDPSVKSYSGYVDVAEDQHIFFWFFEARNQDPKHAPLTVWINGGE
jgi:carboxypeptidase D